MNDKKHYDNLPYQETYGNLLHLFTNVSLAILTVTFVLYLFGILEPVIPTEELPNYWKLSLDEFMKVSGAPTGWSWTGYLNKGDYVNFIGIAVMAGATGVCYLVVLFKALADKRMLFVSFLVIELALITLAASNILSSGGH